MQQVKRSRLSFVSEMCGISKSTFPVHSALLLLGFPQGFFWTNVLSRAFWMEAGMRPSSMSADLRSMITSEGFTSRGHRIVQVLQDVQYQGRSSSMARWNCFFRTIILMLKGVFPASGQLPVHFPHCIQASTRSLFKGP